MSGRCAPCAISSAWGMILGVRGVPNPRACYLLFGHFERHIFQLRICAYNAQERPLDDASIPSTALNERAPLSNASIYTIWKWVLTDAYGTWVQKCITQVFRRPSNVCAYSLTIRRVTKIPSSVSGVEDRGNQLIIRVRSPERLSGSAGHGDWCLGISNEW